MYSSIQEVYDEILAAKAANSALNGLTSTSKFAVWRVWAYVCAVVIFSLDQTFERFKTYVTNLLATRVTHSAAWYAGKMLEFQYGDTVEVINYVVKYPVLDESKRLIKKVAVIDSFGVLIVKAAKEVAGELVALDATEQIAAAAYLVRFKDAGVNTLFQSIDADLLTPKLEIYYDALVPEVTMKTRVNTAIALYLKTYNDGNFESLTNGDGIFSTIKFIDAMQKVEGLKDIVAVQMLFKSILMLSYANFPRVYTPESGYIKIDPAYDLNNGIVNVKYFPV